MVKTGVRVAVRREQVKATQRLQLLCQTQHREDQRGSREALTSNISYQVRRCYIAEGTSVLCVCVCLCVFNLLSIYWSAEALFVGCTFPQRSPAPCPPTASADTCLLVPVGRHLHTTYGLNVQALFKCCGNKWPISKTSLQ